MLDQSSLSCLLAWRGLPNTQASLRGMHKARGCRRVDRHSSSRSRHQCVNRPGNRRGRVVLARQPRLDHRVVEGSCGSDHSDVNSAGSIIRRLAYALDRSSRARSGCRLDDRDATRTGRSTRSTDRQQSLQRSRSTNRVDRPCRDATHQPADPPPSPARPDTA